MLQITPNFWIHSNGVVTDKYVTDIVSYDDFWGYFLVIFRDERGMRMKSEMDYKKWMKKKKKKWFEKNDKTNEKKREKVYYKNEKKDENNEVNHGWGL